MIKVKICGITNLEDAQASIEAGCDAIGFIFYKKSPRYITARKALSIIRQLPKNTIKIGVFVNAREQTIRRVAKICHLKILQFHGNESPEFCSRFKEYKIIKAFRVKSKLDLDGLLKYHPFAFLLDTFTETKIGGTGKKFDWKLVRHIDGIRRPLFLSGGLNKKNVIKAISIARPDWVDASSSVEIRPGKKCHKKIRKFIETAKKGL